jgi:hypothetical protein
MPFIEFNAMNLMHVKTTASTIPRFGLFSWLINALVTRILALPSKHPSGLKF